MRRPAAGLVDCFNFILLMICILAGRLVLALCWVTVVYSIVELPLTTPEPGIYVSELSNEVRLTAELFYSPFYCINDPPRYVLYLI